MFGADSQSWPLITLRCTASIWPWHLVQVLAMLALAMDERGSVCGSTKCAVWQLVQTAATVSPLVKSAWPWRLSVKFPRMLVCGMSWVLLTSLSLLWQLPQRPGISMVEVRDLGFDGRRMLCVPWQVLQPGALLSPRADAFPWRLAVYWVCSSG